ncbi:MAG TPA: hypothetical protein VFM14_04290 [Gemmatimonadales bacterium]|nr:hypothetical protein [Gemmatimonadales bacterium]
MCYHLWIVSPLSLTEIRSMLPREFAADVAPAPEQARFRPLLAGAPAVRLRVGGCACPLLLAGDAEDAHHLRRRYAVLGLPRDRIIAAIESHRRGNPTPGDPAARRAALARFVVEHARNAGPTLYYLGFGPDPSAAVGNRAVAETTSAAGVRAAADTWLPEGRLIEVTR